MFCAAPYLSIIGPQEVRQNLYTKSIGAWRKYAQQLKPLIKAMRKYIPHLREIGALPYDDVINWDMDPNFNYSKVFEPSKMPSGAPTSLRNIIKTSRSATGDVAYVSKSKSSRQGKGLSTGASDTEDEGASSSRRKLQKKTSTKSATKKSASSKKKSTASKSKKTKTSKDKDARSEERV